MKNVRRSLLVLFLALGTVACGPSIMGPHNPDTGQHNPDTGQHNPDTGQHNPDTGN